MRHEAVQRGQVRTLRKVVLDQAHTIIDNHSTHQSTVSPTKPFLFKTNAKNCYRCVMISKAYDNHILRQNPPPYIPRMKMYQIN